MYLAATAAIIFACSSAVSEVAPQENYIILWICRKQYCSIVVVSEDPVIGLFIRGGIQLDPWVSWVGGVWHRFLSVVGFRHFLHLP